MFLYRCCPLRWFCSRVLAKSMGNTQVTPTMPATPPLISLAGRLREDKATQTYEKAIAKVPASAELHCKDCVPQTTRTVILSEEVFFLLDRSDSYLICCCWAIAVGGCERRSRSPQRGRRPQTERGGREGPGVTGQGKSGEKPGVIYIEAGPGTRRDKSTRLSTHSDGSASEEMEPGSVRHYTQYPSAYDEGIKASVQQLPKDLFFKKVCLAVGQFG